MEGADGSAHYGEFWKRESTSVMRKVRPGFPWAGGEGMEWEGTGIRCLEGGKCSYCAGAGIT